MESTLELRQRVSLLLNKIGELELETAGAIQTKTRLESTINDLKLKSNNNKEALDIATHAIEILRQISDETVSEAYKFLEVNLNAALERMFVNTTRKIKIKEYTRNGQYPQLELELEVGNGRKRSLKSDSGHGLAQIVSLLSILSLIVITNSRRIMVMDEVISGLSVHNRKIVNDIMWTFTEIGFQFIVNEHGFIPKGSKVYHFEMVGDVSHIKQSYIATKGVYLQGGNKPNYDYSLKENENVQSGGAQEETADSIQVFNEVDQAENDNNNLDYSSNIEKIDVAQGPNNTGSIVSI